MGLVPAKEDFQEVEGPDQDLPVGGFSVAQNPEPAKDVEKPNLRPFEAVPPGDLPEHMHAKVSVRAVVLQDGSALRPERLESGDKVHRWEVVRELSDDRGNKYAGKSARHITQLQAFSTVEEAVAAAKVSAKQSVTLEEVNKALENNPAQRELYARDAAEKSVSLDSLAAPEQEQDTQRPEQAPQQDANKTVEKKAPEQETDPLHLGDTRKPPEHLFPEKPEQKAPEPEAPAPKKREFPKKDPPEVLLANPRNNKPHVKDFGDHIVVTRRAMFGMGKAAQAKREQAVTVGLQAAAERFGQPVRFEGNPAFLEETAKQAVKLGIKLEPGNKLAEAIYAKALDARDKEIRIATKRDMVFAPSKEKEKTKEKGVGLSR